MLTQARRVAIIGGNRIPFARAHGAYATATNQDMMTAALNGLVERFHLNGEFIGDVSLGSVIKHSKDWNLARECVLGSGLAPETPGYDIQRACGTSLEASIQIAHKIALGQIDAGIAGGTDSISDVPITYPRGYQQILLESFRARKTWDRIKPFFGVRPKHFKPLYLGVVEPRTNLSMGQSTELMAKTWDIKREDQDKLALLSHQNAAKAQAAGFFDDLMVPFAGIDKDNNVRANSSLEKLASLKPVFDRSDLGTLTAANSTPLTDGAACVLLASEAWAKAHNLPVQAYLTFGKAAAVDFVHKKEGLLMAPAYAVSQMLDDAGLSLQDFDFYEIHEAFAAQVLCTLKAWESDKFCQDRLGKTKALGSIDRSKLNINGGSIAVGHPFAATGARIVAGLAKMLKQKGQGRGLISVCTAGGMGVTAIIEAA